MIVINNDIAYRTVKIVFVALYRIRSIKKKKNSLNFEIIRSSFRGR